MTNAKDSAYARPSSEYDGRQVEGCKGLTKREYFAALAMQGILTNSLFDTELEIQKSIAALSVVHADALIEQLNKQS